MADAEWVTVTRACELLAVEDAGGEVRPLARSAVHRLVRQRQLHARGTSRDRLIERKSILAYLRGERGEWHQKSENGEHQGVARSDRSQAGARKPVTQTQAGDTGHGIVIAWRKPSNG